MNQFAVVNPEMSVCDNHAIVFQKTGLLRKYLLGQFRGHPEISGSLTSLCLPMAFWSKATGRLFSHDRWEWMRSAGYPAFDVWARTRLRPGDSVLSSYGYANHCFEYARKTGGKTFLEAGNSHPEQFWEIVQEEHYRWGIDRDPIPGHWNLRGREMLEHTDYVLSPSSYVTESFVSRGWDESRIFHLPYPVNLSIFTPASNEESSEAPTDRVPLRVICTGSVSLRKGFPCLLEAMRIVRKERDAILLLTDIVESSMRPILPNYADVPIEWSSPLAYRELAERLRTAHVFALLSLEEGLARTIAEALACGLPAVVSTNTGASDYIVPGVNGEIVPVRDANAAAQAILRSADLPRSSPQQIGALLDGLTFNRFEEQFIDIMRRLGYLPKS